jgi:hypothetical protein
MIDLHERLITAIPNIRRELWNKKIDEFYRNNFRNFKPPDDELTITVNEIIDEIIDEINENDDEVTYDQKQKLSNGQKKKKGDKNYNQLIEDMKNSLSVGNNSIGSIETNFENLEQAKGVITSISNEIDFHQKQTLKYTLQAGQCLKRIQELCQMEKKKFFDFLKECGIKWNKSYVHFLISFYNFSKDYPKICNISFSTHFVKNNFKKIKIAIWSSNVEREYWKNL